MSKKTGKNSLFFDPYSVINFTNMTDNEKNMILEWRNSESVRKMMLNENIITIDEHYKYIDSLKTNYKKLCFLVKEGDDYLGIIEFSEIDDTAHTADIALNTDPKIKRSGIGTKLFDLIYKISSRQLHLKKLKLSVFEYNVKAIGLYKKMGFKITGTKIANSKKLIFMEKEL